MPNVPDDYVLRPGERPMPIVWLRGPMTLPLHPDVSDEALEVVFGPGGSRKLKSWGHDERGVHWLATRNGSFMHQDLTYVRYTHHLLLRNDGWRLRGFVDDERPPVLVVGHMYCLDTHSPHQVVRDDRLFQESGLPHYKLQLAVDRPEPLSPEEAWALLAPRLRRGPAKDAEGGVPAAAPTGSGGRR